MLEIALVLVHVRLLVLVANYAYKCEKFMPPGSEKALGQKTTPEKFIGGGFLSSFHCNKTNQLCPFFVDHPFCGIDTKDSQ